MPLSTTARSVLGDDVPLIDDAVTVEHLLGHRSGIGDYFDEELQRPITDHVLPVPVHALDTIEAHVPVLNGHPMKFRPGERFSYCNSGFVVSPSSPSAYPARTAFHDLVVERLCRPAGLSHTAFLRSDEPPREAAIGYLDDVGPRSNTLHVPVRGAGDGGLYSTAADTTFWAAMFEGRVVSADGVAKMTHPYPDAPGDSADYGMGFWLHPTAPEH